MKKPLTIPDEGRLRKNDFEGEANGDGTDQADYDGLDQAKTSLLKEENQENVEGSKTDAPNQRNAKEKVEGNGRSNHFRQIAGCDGDLRDEPEAH